MTCQPGFYDMFQKTKQHKTQSTRLSKHSGIQQTIMGYIKITWSLPDVIVVPDEQ